MSIDFGEIRARATELLEARDAPQVALRADDAARLLGEIRRCCEELEMRRGAERAARENEERLELLGRATGDAVWDWSPDTDRVWRGGGFATLTGEQSVGDDMAWWIERIHPDDRREVLARVDGALVAGDGRFENHYRFRRVDGSWLPVIDRAVVLRDERGAPTRVIGAISDAARIRDLQEQLSHAQRVELLGRLAAGVAHDFNNILFVIRGWLPALGRPGESTAEAVQAIDDATSHAAELTRRLLALSRRALPDPRPIDLVRTLDDFSRLFRRVLPERVQFTVTRPECLCPVMADPGQLEQVFMNLCVNACDAMPDGGTLSMELYVRDGLPAAAAGALRGGGGRTIELDVADTGAGMSPEVLQRLFEPFFTTKPAGKGTGLGLATVDAIVRALGGSITVDSKEGIGSRFRILFPMLAEMGSDPERVDDEQTADFASLPVVLAEDSPAVRHMLAQRLRAQGCVVHPAATVTQALVACRKLGDRVGIGITDLVMPDYTGIDLVRRAREVAPGLRWIICTGHAHAETLAEAESLGVVRVLQKPVDVSRIFSVMAQIVRSAGPAVAR